MLTCSGKGDKARALLIKISGGICAVAIVYFYIVGVCARVVEITLIRHQFVPGAVLNHMDSCICIDTRVGNFDASYHIRGEI